MLAHEPKEVIHSYLLNSAHLGDDVAVPHSIHILREQQIDQFLSFIITYTTQPQEQRYIYMQVAQAGEDMWSFSDFQMMGGYRAKDLTQNMRPQIAWTRSCDNYGTLCALASFPSPEEATYVRLREGSNVVYDEPLENGVLLFFTKQHLRENLHVELINHNHDMIDQYLI